MAEAQLVQPDLEFIKTVRRNGGDTLKRCYQCATCSVVCELSPSDEPFPRKEMLWAGWGQRERLIGDPDVWLCHQCNDCTKQCPRGARPGDVLAAIRTYVYENFAFPGFMGRALSSPKALPVLFLVPIVIILAAIFLSAPRTPSGDFLFLSQAEIDFNIFMPHTTVDGLFVFGNILIFLFAAIGFKRFWNELQRGRGEVGISFVSAAVMTAKEIFSHEKFRECGQNRPRAAAHMILFYGFLGAMVTTGLVLVFVFLPHYLHLLGMQGLDSFFHVPIDLPHPVKILGALSGMAILVGGVMLIVRRWSNRDAVGANGYADYLFLYIVTLTGLTGMFSWLSRPTGVPMLAYGNYFLHLVFVYFLLWYMPYSKFAHMIYRTLAIIHARQIGRESRNR
jgi:quinone-modifying oxidoreductase subunit QmoC